MSSFPLSSLTVVLREGCHHESGHQSVVHYYSNDMDHLLGWLAPKPKDKNNKDDDNNNREEEEEGGTLLEFPTHPGFTIPVEIKPTPHLGPGQYGVFAAADIPKHTQFWIWTDRVVEIPSTQMASYIQQHFYYTNNNNNNDPSPDLERIRTFLRRGFVLPPPYDDVFYSNPTDAGTFMNHSSKAPNCARPHGTSRFIHKGEELTMDYSGNGNPLWYQDLCHQYGILTAVELALEETARGGTVQPALYQGQVHNSLLEQMIPF